MDEYWIEFDIDEVVELLTDYRATMITLKELLPDVNWDSRLETKDFFISEYEIYLKSLKISDIEHEMNILANSNYLNESGEQALEVLTLLREYLKLKYTCKNYLEMILRHNKEGRVYLIEHNGQWVMPNRQSANIYSPDIKSTIKAQSLPKGEF